MTDDFQSLPGSPLIKRAMEVAVTGRHSFTIIDCNGLQVEYALAFKCIGGDPPLITTVQCCPCGNFNHTGRKCTCIPAHVTRFKQTVAYRKAMLSDIIITADPVHYTQIMSTHLNESAALVGKRTQFTKLKLSEGVNPDAALLLKLACDKYCFNAKEQIQILAVTNTIMNLAGDTTIRKNHIAEAVKYKIAGRS